MGEIAEGIGAVDLGAGGIVVLVVLMVLTGRLVTRKQLDEQREETRYWRTAHGVEVEARQLANEQVKELLEQGRTTAALVRALKLPPVEDVSDDGGGTS